jgi:epoxyqueuosine reductase QueG
MIEMSQEEFSNRFRKSAIKRTKLAGLQRNARAVMKGRETERQGDGETERQRDGN